MNGQEVVELNRFLSTSALPALFAFFSSILPCSAQEMGNGNPTVGGAPAIEPPFEVALEVSHLAELDGGRGTVDLLLIVTPLTEPVRVTWEVIVPSPLSVLSGGRDGSSPIRMGEKLERGLTVSIPDGHRYYVHARAILETERGELFTRAVSQVIDLGAPDIAHPPFIRHDPVRGDVTSFRGVVLGGGDQR